VKEKPQPEPQPEWLDLQALTRYAAVSERTLRTWIHDPVTPLPACQVGKKILVRRRDFDMYLEKHRLRSTETVKTLVDEILGKVAS
jgi:hypothetical protein